MAKLLAVGLVLVGSNLFTYGFTRYCTTKDVLISAQARMDNALRDEGVYEQLYPTGRATNDSTFLAIRQAGGRYYGWNESVPYRQGGIVLVAVGILVFSYKLKHDGLG